MLYIFFAIIISLILAIIYLFAFPGIFLVKGNNLKGYWSDISGNIYKIIPINSSIIHIINENKIIYGKIKGTIFNCNIYISNDKNTIVDKGVYKMNTNTIIFNLYELTKI